MIPRTQNYQGVPFSQNHGDASQIYQFPIHFNARAVFKAVASLCVKTSPILTLSPSIREAPSQD